MTVKALLAAVLFFGSVTVAGAQTKPTEPVTNGMEAVTSAVVGWNYVRASNCTGINGYFYLVDTNGGIWFSNDTIVLIALAPACQSGNWIGFHVLANGTWDQIYTFTFK